MKVAWICPFETNIFSKKYNLPKTRVLAPWITSLVREFQKMHDIELHIITTLTKLKKPANFIENGTNFHLIPSGIPLLGRGFPTWFPLNLITNYSTLRKKIKALINEIHPDIIHLHGTENNYSSAIIDITFPSVVSIQGLAHNRRDSGLRSWKIEKKVRIEAEIFKKKKNFIVNLLDMERIIRKYNPQAKIFYSSYPINSETFEFDPNIKPDVDVLFAARVTPEKGIEDLLAAMMMIMQKGRPITARVIGSCTNKYHNYLKREISRMKLEDKIDFIGYVEDQCEVFSYMKRAKIYVLPTHFDATPRSVSESLALGTPVIAYDVGGLNTQIEDQKNGLLIQPGNISALADAIIDLLQDEEKRSQFATIARKTSSQLHAQPISKGIISIYNEILEEEFE